METVLNCGPHNWAMITGVIATYGVLLLGAAALIKYLFFSRRTEKAT